MDYFNYSRRKSSVVNIGNTPLGDENPIRIQSMANVSTMDTEAAVRQAIRMIEAGAEYVRFTAQGEREARNLGEIRKELNAQGYTTPLVADIHFNPRAADAAAEEVEKVRINPGNYVDKVKTFDLLEYTDEEYAAELQKIRDRFVPFLNICKEHGTAIRIGVNHGSLSDRIMSRYGDTPEGMVASCMEFLRICRDENFPDVVISIKASNTVVMVKTVRLLVRTMEAEGMHYPLHLGVTEAGDGEDGRIKSAVGIGTLLTDGIGDTIRVSLSEDPEAEMPVARKLVDYILERQGHKPITASLTPGYDPITATRRISRVAEGIGGNFPPIVISDRSNGDFEFDHLSMPDYIYIGAEDPENLPDTFRMLVDAHFWKERPNAFPYFIASEIEEMKKFNSPLKFIRLTFNDLTSRTLEILKQDPTVVVVLSTHHRNAVGSQRAAMHKLMIAGCDVPVILHREYHETDKESLQLKSAADFGTLLLDGFGNGLMLQDDDCEATTTDSCMFGILQATRTRISKTEYISCPSCGRTLYDLQTTIARIKEATSHLKGLKIGIMGCIVNGPGEMADADYGYVGAGRGQISLYKGKECVLKNVAEEDAVERLVQLIKENGDWQN
ncbi:4-hydroxy-3-methylbut-2-en-1-yl diphosphate synthase [Parabacteroides gordonii]|uniref:4-hydroxy-3-methylbut-2-en-1-yl diphosphate synthase (flavodoxin) n=1 Tax=Parabacteroides gordonii MS-1 = DSM 23371 TaxID=1203610 RepID=A0A0F5JI35_9BACT|nr:4-hydroxy-3-methylbut-2-en-1-yl diphosphate synthase [Parabacteroides gordonii]KKB57384.1 4-hydroxy-3-methylbut-2-en-1-yl diphosphate synthase [Parabacteroides gordonii MS-1 = DSM 23371]MCA5582526.1 4-hydroxy-3-methylbut-2-en-1-yl diphosphate synthase [Parabacteroides gordonii]RGP17767.1 4-hydroxy-3-methylbut-2-en-1-yl diphosphate synthase [Parabacteroides gordonii]